jgi:hypothetical protein
MSTAHTLGQAEAADTLRILADIQSTLSGTVKNSGDPALDIQIVRVACERGEYHFSSWRAGQAFMQTDGRWSDDIERPQSFQTLAQLQSFLETKHWKIDWH